MIRLSALPRRSFELLNLLRQEVPAGPLAVAWAVEMLLMGFDTPSLRCLAGLDLEGTIDSWEAAGLVRAVLDELGMAMPGKEEICRGYLRELAADIVEGRKDPDAAIDEIHSEVVYPLGHPDE